MKKKPYTTVPNAHGGGQTSDPGHVSNEENWITAVAALHNTDMLASGKALEWDKGKIN